MGKDAKGLGDGVVRLTVDVPVNVLRFLRDLAALAGRTPQSLIEEEIQNFVDAIVDDLPTPIFDRETIRRKYNLRTKADC